MLSIALLLPAVLPAEDVDFLKDVWPILESRCIECHGPDKQKGKLRLDTKAGLFGEDAKYPPVVAGDLHESSLWELINLPADDPDVMPAEGDPLTADQIDVLKRWIEGGAAWAQPEVASSKPDPLALPQLTDEQRKTRDVAMAKLAEQGLYALTVAAGHDAVDVNLSLQRTAVGDAQLELLGGLEPVLVWLNLSGTSVADGGLKSVANFKQLRRLNLSKTGVTDAGLAHVTGLGELTYLNLYGTKVTDAGLMHLTGLTKLEKVFLWQTEVTDAGAATLAKALPGLKINRGVELAAKAAEPTPVNAKCPVSGQEVDAAHFSELEGQRVAFCCGDCKAKFDADPASFAAKVDGFAAAPINDKCPVTGQPVDKAQTVSFEGKTVGFCCGKCKAAFEKEPAKFAAKIGG
ncbi:MAG: hypothetical protein O2816_11225 [Planctomycetota bacterium]|nr:hypothetical protein [Planctomycetota bacterium]